MIGCGVDLAESFHPLVPICCGAPRIRLGLDDQLSIYQKNHHLSFFLCRLHLSASIDSLYLAA